MTKQFEETDDYLIMRDPDNGIQFSMASKAFLEEIYEGRYDRSKFLENLRKCRDDNENQIG